MKTDAMPTTSYISEMGSMLDSALDYARHGFYVIPLHTPQVDGRCSCRDPGCKSVGKHPRTSNGVHDATTDEERIRRWWRHWPDANIGVVCGPSGLVVIDIDPRNGGDDAWESLRDAIAFDADTVVSLTGGGGQHFFYSLPDGIEPTDLRGELGSGVDVKRGNAYVVAPPSLHHSGNLYEFELSGGPCDVDIAVLPDALLAELKRNGKANVASVEFSKELPDVAILLIELRESERPSDADLYDLITTDPNETASRLGKTRSEVDQMVIARLRKRDADPDLIKAIFVECPVGEKFREQGVHGEQYLVNSIGKADVWLAGGRSNTYKVGASEFREENTRLNQPDDVHGGLIRNTDLGNARRLVTEHAEDLRYCHAWSSWLVWDGQRWAKDGTGVIQRRARQTVAGIYSEASQGAATDARRELARWAMRSEARDRLNAMVGLAKDEPGIPIRHDDLDADPWLFNVADGTLDLRTGELRPHRREDLITKMSPVEYDPTATCPRWIRFLVDVLPDPMLRAFINRAIGHSLTGHTGEQCLFFLYGAGNNGKTTFVETQRALFGDYAQKAPIDMLMVKRGGIPNDVARLPGARLVVVSEVERGRRLAESLVKDLTGGDTLVARFMRQEFFEFTPTHKLWMYGNHKPEIRGTDEGIWRRIHLIPFTVQIPEDKVDPGLPEKLKEELPGILAWAVKGCQDWQQNGLGVPSAVSEATSVYRAQMDVLGRFLDECCYRGPSARATKAELHSAYVFWGGDLGKRRFGEALRERGFGDGHGTGNVAIWRGVGLLSD